MLSARPLNTARVTDGVVPAERGAQAKGSPRCGVRASVCRPPTSFRSTLAKRHVLSLRPVVRRERSRIVSMSQDGLSDEVEAATKKYGLEGGMWKILTSSDEGGAEGVDPKLGKAAQAKELLKRYGSAYLITSITLSLISFGFCYALVNAGVDIGGLLQKVGLEVTTTSEKVGTVAIAYAAHKAASPIRFPPTVALTPLVAKALGKSAEEKVEADESAP